jgi:Uma2 family endonuclease
LETHGITRRVLFAPWPIRLGPGKYREPDLIYLTPPRMEDLAGQPEGAERVMVVVSEGSESRHRDLQTKPHEYAEAGIREYWIVDPQNREITVLAWEYGSYRAHGVFASDSVGTSVYFPGLGLPVGEVFAVGESAAGS